MGISQRLRHRSEFAAVYRHGRPFRNEFLVLRALRTDRPDARFGFATGRALGGAVVRNRVKRRLRQIIGALRVSGGWDIVLNARSTAVGAQYTDLSTAVETLLRRAGALQ